ncbi:RAD55 family ATPase [Natronocalculus amylovorans]|uniref:AAA family ATPase n=1 Tax=Natronocalculus amylovorans TaxID=2917812 RepID=A0AAE3FX23_9EURY|nr:ATPase domain-containing protein [Natronocalculus amylovorans]MCL9816485.1 AAA family ATPase [Natronocalculus amylovorans]NUE00931.1 AAA family ATPase [Halorubraceae archaeon YAN]
MADVYGETEYELTQVPSGDAGLDRLLDGGFPANRAILLSGGPGTGKSTFAMQFLQAGLDDGDRALYVTTEQTREELCDSFAPFSFELDDPNLSIASVHARPGQRIDGVDGLMLSELQRDEDRPHDFYAPFTTEYLEEHLTEYLPVDRIVVDSLSGIAPMADNPDLLRRDILELIRLFADRFDATTLLIAEEPDSGAVTGSAAPELLRFAAHGVISLSHEPIRGDYHRYLRVEKLRGVDHDTRMHEFEITRNGPTVVSRWSPTQPVGRVWKTGVPGLDELGGGGLSKGQSVVLSHDGRARVSDIVAEVAVESLLAGAAVPIFVPGTLGREWVETKIASRISSLGQLLDENRLFIIDWYADWDYDHPNIYRVHKRGLTGMLTHNRFYVMQRIFRIYRSIDERRGSRDAVPIVYSETALQELSAKDLRFQHGWIQANLLTDDDTIIFVQNPRTMDERLAEFYVFDAQQVFETWVEDQSDLQYIRLDKGAHGKTGVTRLVKRDDGEPGIQVQSTVSQAE